MKNILLLLIAVLGIALAGQAHDPNYWDRNATMTVQTPEYNSIQIAHKEDNSGEGFINVTISFDQEFGSWCEWLAVGLDSFELVGTVVGDNLKKYYKNKATGETVIVTTDGELYKVTYIAEK